MDTRCADSVIFFIISLVVAAQKPDESTAISQVTKPMPKFPKCCESLQQYWGGDRCEDIGDITPSYVHKFYESYESVVNEKPITINLTFYQHIGCLDPSVLTYEEIRGFLYNNSVSLYGSPFALENSEYCVDVDTDGTTPFTILKCPPTSLKDKIYFICLIFSTGCYFFAAIIYQFILKVQEVHKRCFICYTLCMGTTFICLILLKKIDTSCEYLGSAFIFFILLSFVWLCLLCIDVIYTIKKFNEVENSARIYSYISTSFLIPLIMLDVSLIPTGIPDIPNSFATMGPLCKFKEENTRITILFAPIGVLLLISTGSLIYSYCIIKANEEIYKCNIIWLEKVQLFKYMVRSCFLIVLTSTIWMIDAALKNELSMKWWSYNIIEGIQGIFLIAIFVFNRYTRKEIYGSVLIRNMTFRGSHNFRHMLGNFKRYCETSSIISHSSNIEDYGTQLH